MQIYAGVLKFRLETKIWWLGIAHRVHKLLTAIRRFVAITKKTYYDLL